MFSSTRKTHLLFGLLAAFILALVTSACGIHQPLPGTVTSDIDILIKEDMFWPGRIHFSVNDHDFYDSLLDNVNHLELHDGYIRFIGTRTLPSGSMVPGSVDLYLDAQDGMLIARIIAVDIPGVDMNDPLVEEINQELEVELKDAMISPDATVLFKDVQVTEGELRLKIQVTVRF